MTIVSCKLPPKEQSKGDLALMCVAEFQIVASRARTLEEPSSFLVNKLQIPIASIRLASICVAVVGLVWGCWSDVGVVLG